MSYTREQLKMAMLTGEKLNESKKRPSTKKPLKEKKLVEEKRPLDSKAYQEIIAKMNKLAIRGPMTQWERDFNEFMEYISNTYEVPDMAKWRSMKQAGMELVGASEPFRRALSQWLAYLSGVAKGL